MRRAKKAVKYNVNPDAGEISSSAFSSLMATSTYRLKAIADNSSTVAEEVMHGTYSLIYIYINISIEI